MGCNYYTDYFYEVDEERINIRLREKHWDELSPQDSDETDDDYSKRCEEYIRTVYNATKKIVLRDNYEWVIPDNAHRRQASSYITGKHISLQEVQKITYVEQSWERF